MTRTKKAARRGQKAKTTPSEKDTTPGDAVQQDAQGSKGKGASMTLAKFNEFAQSKGLEISNEDGSSIAELVMHPQRFSSGSYGWSLSKKLELPLSTRGGESVQVQLSFNMTVIGSKPADSTTTRSKKRKADGEAVDDDEAESNGEEGESSRK